MEGGFAGAFIAAGRVGLTGASAASRAGSAASRAGSAATRSAGKGISRLSMKPKPSAGLKPKPKPSPPQKPQMTRQQRINKAGEEAGKKRPGNKRTNAQRQKNAQTARNKAASRANKNSPGQDGMSAADGVSTAAGAIPLGGTGQSSGYGNIASSMASGVGAAGLSAGLGAAGAFATSAAEGTSAEALERASEKGTRKGQNAADTAADALAAATSGSIQTRVAGTTSGIVQKHKKTSCPCRKNIEAYKKIQRGLPEGLKQTIAQYYILASRCNCTEDNEELANDFKNKILASKNQLTMYGRPFGRTELYKRIAMTQKRPSNIQKIKQNIKRGGYMRLAGTRKKSRGVIYKKSRTRKQRPQSTQSRRRTRKN